MERDGVEWEGQVLIAGAGTQLPARLILTRSRLVLATASAIALDIPRTWLQPRPTLLQSDPSGNAIRLSVTPEGTRISSRTTERLVLRMRGGQDAAERLVGGIAGAAAPARDGAQPEQDKRRTADPPVWNDRVGAATPIALPPLPDLVDEETERQPWPPLEQQGLPAPRSRAQANAPRSARPRSATPPPQPGTGSTSPATSATGVALAGRELAPLTGGAAPRDRTRPGAPRPDDDDATITFVAAEPHQFNRALVWSLRTVIVAILVGAGVYFGGDRLALPAGFDLSLPPEIESRLGINDDAAESDQLAADPGQPAANGSRDSGNDAGNTVTSDGTNGPSNGALEVGGTSDALPSTEPAAADDSVTEEPVPTDVPVETGGTDDGAGADESGSGGEDISTEEPAPPVEEPEPTTVPTEEPTAVPTAEPTEVPTPTEEPTPEPTATVAPTPTAAPTEVPPTATIAPSPTPTPTEVPPTATVAPTPTPTEAPTATIAPSPTPTPTEAPPTATVAPTAAPTEAPTATGVPPTAEPTETSTPTEEPNPEPTATEAPPTAAPTTAPTAEPTLESLPPSVDPATPPAQSVASGAFRFSIEGAAIGDTIEELPEVADVGNYGEWIVLSLYGENWSDNAQAFDMSQFTLVADDEVIPLDVGNGWVASQLGFTPAYGNTDAVLWAPGEGHPIALTFLVPPGTETLVLRTEDQAIDLTVPLEDPGSLVQEGAPPAPEYIEAEVVEVIDGETIIIEKDSIRQEVGYLGIDAPTGDECHAAEATAANAGLVEGKTVRIERQATNVDAQGNWVRDVWVEAEEGQGRFLLVSEALVSEGAVEADITEPNTRFAGWLMAAQSAAQADADGLWDACESGASRGPSHPETMSIPPARLTARRTRHHQE